MLLSVKYFKQGCSLKTFPKHQFTNGKYQSFTCVEFRSKIFNLDHIFSRSFSISSKSYSTSSVLESFPIENIENANVDYLKCDAVTWHKLLQEITCAKVNGNRLPSSLNLSNIDDLLQLESQRQRLKFLTFLFKKEKKKKADEEKRLKKKNERKNTISENVTDHIQYGLGKNTLLLSCRHHAINKFYDKRLSNAVIFGQKMVFDLGYDEFMWKKERRDCAAQLRLVHSINRQNYDPYDLYFCNVNTDSFCVKYLLQDMPNINESLTSLTEKSYLDVFPKKNLVYLSPHASETLQTYDHSAVYIIGGFVDTKRRDHLSLQKSQEEGIKSLSLPLDEHVLWGAGSKSLSINQVFSIMMTLKDTGDWRKALQHIPSRKIRRLEPNSDEIKYAPDKMFLIKK